MSVASNANNGDCDQLVRARASAGEAGIHLRDSHPKYELSTFPICQKYVYSLWSWPWRLINVMAQPQSLILSVLQDER